MARRRTCANAADYLSGHRCGSSRRLGTANGAKPPDPLCADRGGRQRSIYIGGEKTHRPTKNLWGGPEAPPPPPRQRGRASPREKHAPALLITRSRLAPPTP